ncbi:HAD family hydrolase [Rhizobium sp. SSA_523]|uniref:HAD family hydrolase n=1 Tax=Rhizobium sp. SSA_523 TaxID=2952477 RepID=UPI0020915A96|nr:HAD family hydrolase [Rhizobium sp. SSA_523]MCO5731139.1 HAD family hydrolase [Rhizobium sp. SSA_523]WKC24067.1 HAD family hydrolase [Rhizobium sp. SSA_523]
MAAPLSSIRGLLFDKDGTLLRYDESWAPVNREAARIAAAGLGKALEDRLLHAAGMDPVTGRTQADSLFAAGTAAQIAAGFVAAGSPFTADALTVELDNLFVRASDFSVPVLDLGAYFARLKARGYALGVASSDNERSIRETARRFGFLEKLDYIAGYDSGHGCKPQPGMVLGFCKATGLLPSQVAVVGDNNHDLHMAAAAGAGLKVAVLTGTGSLADLEAAADHVLGDIAGLETLLAPVPVG